MGVLSGNDGYGHESDLMDMIVMLNTGTVAGSVRQDVFRTGLRRRPEQNVELHETHRGG